jgi:hypothetical protein
MGLSALQSKLLLPLRADGVVVPLVVVVVRQLFLDWTRTVLVTGHAADMVEAAVRAWCPRVEFLRLPWTDDPSRCIRTVIEQENAPVLALASGDVLVHPDPLALFFQRLGTDRVDKEAPLLFLLAPRRSTRRHATFVVGAEATVEDIRIEPSEPQLEPVLVALHRSTLAEAVRGGIEFRSSIVSGVRYGSWARTALTALDAGQQVRAIVDHRMPVNVNTPYDLVRAQAFLDELRS